MWGSQSDDKPIGRTTMVVTFLSFSLVRGGIYHVTNLGCAGWNYSHEWGFYYPEFFSYNLVSLYVSGCDGQVFDEKAAPQCRFTMKDHSFVRSWSFLIAESFSPFASCITGCKATRSAVPGGWGPPSLRGLVRYPYPVINKIYTQYHCVTI